MLNRHSLFKAVPFSFLNQSIIFVIGAPGSGKGTHCKRLEKNLGFRHLSTGDLLNELMTQRQTSSDPQDQAFIRYINDVKLKGELLDDQFILDLVINAMKKHPQAKGFLIDGCPRTIGQCHLFEKQVKRPDLILFLDAEEKVLQERILGRALIEHRIDDNEKTILKRLETYRAQTLPVIHYLIEAMPAQFKHIESIGTVEAVAERIDQAIENKAPAFRRAA